MRLTARAADARSTIGSRSTGSSTGSRSTGSRSTGSRSTGSRSTGSRSTGSSTGSRSTGSRSTGSRTAGRRPSDGRIGARRRASAITAVGLAAALALAGCGSSNADAAGTGAGTGTGTGTAKASSDVTLTVYNAQHQSLTQAMVDGFTKATGIKVQMRNGDDSEMANQIIQEGKASPADVFLTENSPAMTLVASKGLFAPVDAATKAQIPSKYQPSDGMWIGWAARSTVFVYNKAKLSEADLPKSIMDLEQPQWKGKIGVAAAGADFQAIVSAVLALKGEQATQTWLDGLKTNAKVYQGNNAVMKAVNSGEISGGVIYHYYWYRDQAESGANSNNTALYFFGHQDPGAFVSVSGAGVLASSKHQAQAQEFVKYLTSKAGQEILANSDAMEYPIADGVAPNKALKPLSDLDAPTVDISSLNGPQVVQMMQKAGLL